MGEDSGWRITAVCHPAQQLLGIDLVAMRAGAVTLTHFVTDVVNTLEAVRESTDGCVVNLRNVTPQGSDDGGNGGGERGFSSTCSIVAKLQVCLF